VTSDFSGRFTFGNGTLALSTLTFDVPGAIVKLNGQYSLRPETLAFSGDLVLDAKMSETTTGWKSLALKMVDPLFRKDGRTIIPIKITGTRDDPSFGIDARRILRR
jgi:AsmA-like C-terminal region